jgi:hypothetical protein
LIRVFCVFLVGEPFLREGDPKEFGFYRNEYVVSSSEERAVAAAKAKTMKRLQGKPIKFIDGKPFTLKVENIKSGMSPLRLLRNEGFLFFPVNEPAQCVD